MLTRRARSSANDVALKARCGGRPCLDGVIACDVEPTPMGPLSKAVYVANGIQSERWSAPGGEKVVNSPMRGHWLQPAPVQLRYWYAGQAKQAEASVEPARLVVPGGHGAQSVLEL